MLSISGLHYRYKRRYPPVLNGVDLELPAGKIGVLLGRNGSGKTTLFNVILGICKPEKGSVRFDGMDLCRLPRRERARIAAYVPQDIRFGALTVFDTVLMGRMAYFGIKTSREDHEAVARILDSMGLAPLAGRLVTELSGGERQKIAVARALAQEPRLMVFDEPTGNLDIANEHRVMDMARELAARGICVLISLHDLNQALELGDRFFFIKNGVIKYSGGEEAFTPEVIADIYGVSVRIAHAGSQKIILRGEHP